MSLESQRILLVTMLVVVIALAAVFGWMKRAGVFPRTSAVLESASYGFGAVVVVWLGWILLPREWGASLIIAAIVVVAIAWSTRQLLFDVIAGVILVFERRIKKGMWVSGEGFQGTVEKRTLRATWLRDAQGHRLTVPNSAMVGAPIVYDVGGDAEHEVVIRLEGYERAADVRRSLHDAVLGSPWVLAGATPVVLRDPADPVVWRVRSRLLEPRFAVHFEGELLERVEDLLRFEAEREIEERATVPHEPPELADTGKAAGTNNGPGET